MKKIGKRTTDAARRAIPANADPSAGLSTSTPAEDRVRELEEQLRAMGAIGASMATTVGLDALFKELVPNISRLMRAERSTLFVYDEKTREIWSKVAQGHSLTEIRLELGQGIAGWAAEHRETITVFVDVSRAKRILYNLTNNAVDALNRGGRLTVGLAADGGGLRLRVEDTGPGMSSEVRARLFDPFFTAGKLPGTGLGLSIVKRFVDDHHGEIEVESTPGTGTVFTVSLPRPEPEAEG